VPELAKEFHSSNKITGREIMAGTSSRRRILLVGGAMVAAGAGAALLGGHARRQAPKVETAVANPKAKRPNILIIMSDQEQFAE